MLPFMAKELWNSAYCFTTCVNVNKHDFLDVKQFSPEGNTSWKPLNYKN